MDAIKEENNQLKRLTGPSLGKVTQRLDQLENSKPHHPATEWGSLNWDSPITENNKDKPTRKKENRANTKHKVVFDPSRCVVIEHVQDPSQTNKDDHIRRVIGRNKDITIDRISHTYSGNLMAQLSEMKMVDETITTWDTKNFGGSKARKTKVSQYKHGVSKGVTSDIEETDIQDDLINQGYTNVTVKK